MNSLLKMVSIGLLTVPTLTTPAQAIPRWSGTAEQIEVQLHVRGGLACLVRDGLGPRDLAELVSDLNKKIPAPPQYSPMDATLWKAAGYLARQPGYCEEFYDHINKQPKPTYTV